MVTYTPGNVSKYLVMQNTLEETKRKYKEEIERLEKEVKKEREVELESVVAEVKAPMATSNSPTYGHPNSPGQDSGNCNVTGGA